MGPNDCSLTSVLPSARPWRLIGYSIRAARLGGLSLFRPDGHRCVVVDPTHGRSPVRHRSARRGARVTFGMQASRVPSCVLNTVRVHAEPLEGEMDAAIPAILLHR